MIASCFEVSFRIPGAASLKEKRMVVRSIKDRCKSRFNVSVVESGDTDKWQSCKMAFALAALSESTARISTQNIIDFLYDDNRIEVIDIHIT